MAMGQMDEGVPNDYNAIFQAGLRHYENGEWIKAYECFKEAEAQVLNEMGDYFKNTGQDETAHIYYRRSQKAANRVLKLAPPGTNWLTNFLVITGIIAAICVMWLILMWGNWTSILALIVLLFDLMVFIILLPLAIAKHVTNRRKPLSEFHTQLGKIETQIAQIMNQPQLSEFQKFYQSGKLKVKRARMAGEVARYEYTMSLEGRK